MSPDQSVPAVSSFLSAVYEKATLQFAPLPRYFESTTTTTTSFSFHHHKSLDHVSQSDPKLMPAKYTAAAALSAVIDFLSEQGVSSASIRELRQLITRDLCHASHDMCETDRFNSVLEKAQKYAACLAPCCSHYPPPPIPLADTELTECRRQAAIRAVRLIAEAWEALCYYRSIQYRLAYRQYHNLKRQRSSSCSQMMGGCSSGQRAGAAGGVAGNVLEQADRLQCARAEELCACQREVVLSQAWGKRLQHQ